MVVHDNRQIPQCQWSKTSKISLLLKQSAEGLKSIPSHPKQCKMILSWALPSQQVAFAHAMAENRRAGESRVFSMYQLGSIGS